MRPPDADGDSPAPTGEGPAPPAPSPPLTGPARDRERERLQTLANVQRMRGQLVDARATLQQALALGGEPGPGDAPVHEMLGDILAADERWDEAKTAYGTAHALDPRRASAERKFAQMTLRAADAAAERALAEAVLRGEAVPGGASGASAAGGGAFGGGARGKRNAGLAMLLSGLAPGFGQLYNGQLVKGLICLGIFFVTLLAIRLSPDGDLLVKQAVSLLAGQPLRGARGEVSPLLWLLVFLSAAVWLYALLDAPITASKTESSGAAGTAGVDKSGWEV
jgi:tetratricopeptide (TPR) repeat protein